VRLCTDVLISFSCGQADDLIVTYPAVTDLQHRAVDARPFFRTRIGDRP
jgi:hypothetical protein